MTSVQSTPAVDRHVTSSSPPLTTTGSPLISSPPGNANNHPPSPVPSSPVSSARPGSISPSSSQQMSPSNTSSASANNNSNSILNLTTGSNNQISNNNGNNDQQSTNNDANNTCTNTNINTSTSSPSAVSSASSSSSPSPPSCSQPQPTTRETSPVTSTPLSTASNNNVQSNSNAPSHHQVNPNSTRPLRLRRVNHSDEIVNGFSKLLKNESLTDVTISCSGGVNIKAHRVVLSTFSPYFKSIFESRPFVDTPWTYPVIVMKDYGFVELKAIIEFIYKGEVSVPRDRLSSVLATAKSLEVSGLSDLKVEAFGISPTAPATSHLHHSGNTIHGNGLGSLPLVNGGSNSSIAAASAAPGLGSLTGSLKRSSDLDFSSSNNFSGNNSTIGSADSAMSLAKKLRLLESNNSGATDLSAAGSSLASLSSLQQLQQYAIASGIDLNSLDSVRSLLQQPPRINSFLQQLRQNSSPTNLPNSRSSPSSMVAGGGSPTPTRVSNLSLQQIMTQKAAAAAAQQSAQLANNGQGGLGNRLNPRSLQMQQQHLKQQILQQQLLRSRNNGQGQQNNNGLGGNNGQSIQRSPANNGSGNHIPFMQFQQRIRQQIQEKQRTLGLLNNNSVANLTNKPLLQKHLTLNKDLSKLTGSSLASLAANGLKVENPAVNGYNASNDDDDEVEVIIKEGNDHVKLEQLLKKGVNESIGQGQESQEMNDDDDHQVTRKMSESMLDNDESSEHLVVEEGHEDMDSDEGNHGQDLSRGQNRAQDLSRGQNRSQHEDDEYEIEIDKDAIFQQQQQLRLQQIQKQQQNYQLQMQLEQEEQEQRLLEYHQSLSQAAPSSEGDHDDGDNSSSNNGFGFDWQEGFTDDLPRPDHETMMSHLNNSGNNGTSGTQNRSTPLTTPDFLQPRGPGRPRKGNKAQEISPCPECNKVFVRPDVLKLHYRSVHLNERHPCNLCPKIFKWPGDLSKHKRTKHPDKYPPANANNQNNPIVVHH